MELILLLIILINFKKNRILKLKYKNWDVYINTGIAIAITLFVLGNSVESKKSVFSILSCVFIFFIANLIINNKDFKEFRSTLFTVLPLTIILFISKLTKLISKSFYTEYNTIFSTAIIAGLVWLIVMLILNKRQAKALERERIKNEELERKSKISETMKAQLEIQVNARTIELKLQKDELQLALHDLKDTQAQLIQAEKMASLGELTAGIAHEIQNPLNFVNNFSEVNKELLAEMHEEIVKGNYEEVKAIAKDISANEEKIIYHGKRADAIVKGMLQHSRTSTGAKEPTDMNALADEYLRLAYHGLRAKDKTFNATMKTDYEEQLQKVDVIPQDLGRVILNLITNAFYVVDQKKKLGIEGYEPTVWVSTKKIDNELEITVRDNGSGIPENVVDKIFNPFFTTKPTGQGTGLGLSLSYDIVKAHGGELLVETNEGTGTVFTINLPLV